jgi:hypothetical protein
MRLTGSTEANGKSAYSTIRTPQSLTYLGKLVVFCERNVSAKRLGCFSLARNARALCPAQAPLSLVFLLFLQDTVPRCRSHVPIARSTGLGLSALVMTWIIQVFPGLRSAP